MKKNKVFALLGGDLRQVHIAKGLAAKGFHVRLFGFDNYSEKIEGIALFDSAAETMDGADSVILPLPFSTDGIYLNAPYISYRVKMSDIYDNLKKDTVVYC